MVFTNLFSPLSSGKAFSSSHCDNEFVVATDNKNLEILIVNSDCKKKNRIKNDLLIDNPVDVYSVNSITNLDCVYPMVGNNEKLQHIQWSFLANILNYVTAQFEFAVQITRVQSLVRAAAFP